jgi:hypothetical protein
MLLGIPGIFRKEGVRYEKFNDSDLALHRGHGEH